MLVLIISLLFCGAIGVAVVAYVMIEARREGRGEFWTPEGEELIAGAKRAGEKVVSKGEALATSAAEHTRELRERFSERRSGTEQSDSEGEPVRDQSSDLHPGGKDVDPGEEKEPPGALRPSA